MLIFSAKWLSRSAEVFMKIFVWVTFRRRTVSKYLYVPNSLNHWFTLQRVHSKITSLVKDLHEIQLIYPYCSFQAIRMFMLPRRLLYIFWCISSMFTFAGMRCSDKACPPVFGLFIDATNADTSYNSQVSLSSWTLRRTGSVIISHLWYTFTLLETVQVFLLALRNVHCVFTRDFFVRLELLGF